MANIILDVRASTSRALNEFKSFSRQLDNKFLISGLKLDSVKSALNQINREFERVLGDQDTVGKNSIRSIQNQNALILNAYKGLGKDVSTTLVREISLGLNEVAKRTGASIDDVRKSMNAASLFPLNFSREERDRRSKQILELQNNLKLSGVTDNFAGLAQDFLGRRVSAGQLMESGDPFKVDLGLRLARSSNGSIDFLPDVRDRAKVFFEAIEGMNAEAEVMAERTAGFKLVLNKLNSYLFNQETGVFGAFKQITLLGEATPTTSFDETKKLIEAIFGVENGAFITFFREIGEVFGLDADSPLAIIIRITRFITRQINRLTFFFRGDTFESIIRVAKEIFDGISTFFSNLKAATEIDLQDANPDEIILTIEQFGEDVRAFIRSLGEKIRNADTDDETSFAFKIASTVAEELASTLGTLVSEVFKTLLNKGPQIAQGLLTTFQRGIEGLFKGVFGDEAGGALATAAGGVGAFIPGPIGQISRAFLGTKTANATLGEDEDNSWAKLAMVGGLAFLPNIIGAARNLGRGVASATGFVTGRGPGGVGGGGTGRGQNTLLGRLGNRFINPNMGMNPYQRQVITLLEQIAQGVGGAGLPGQNGGGGGGGGGRRRRFRTIFDRQRLENLRLERQLRDEQNSDRDITNLLEGEGTWERRQARRARGEARRQRVLAGRRRLNMLGIGAQATLGTAGIMGATALGSYGVASLLEDQNARTQVGNVLGGAVNGALLGGTLGSFIPVIGSAVGAAIGGVIGGAIPLMNQETRDGVRKFGQGITNVFSQGVSDLGRSIANIWGGIGTRLAQAREGLVNSVTSAVSSIDWGQAFKGLVVNANPITAVLNSMNLLGPAVDRVRGFFQQFRLPSWLGGQQTDEPRTNPGLSAETTIESIISSRDSSKFVIPQTQLSALESAVAAASGPSAPSKIEMNSTIQLNITASEANIAQIKENLRPAVMEVINEAWTAAKSGYVPRGVYAS